LPHDGLAVVQSVAQATPIPASLAQAIVAKAAGNPFFLEELTWAVVEGSDGYAVLAIPDTIQAVLAARIDRLPLAEKRLLQAAAVIGTDVPMPLLHAVTGVAEEELAHRLQRLQGADFLYETHLIPTLIYTFKHVLTRDVAYQLLLTSVRQQYHRQIADVLEKRFSETVASQPALLAYHYTEAGLVEHALPYWHKVGQRALERSAYVKAIAHLTKGLELLKTLPDTPVRDEQEFYLQVALSVPLRVLKGYGALEVETTYRRVQELGQRIGDTPQLFPVLCGLWEFYLLRMELHRARQIGEQLLSLAQGAQDATFLTRAHSSLGVALLSLGELAPARAHLEQEIMLYDPEQGGSHAFLYVQDAQVVCLALVAWALWLLGYPDQALKRARQAVAFARELSQPLNIAFALNHGVIVAQLCRDAQLTREWAEALMALSTDQGFPHLLGIGSILRGWVLSEHGAQGVVGQAGRAEGSAQIRRGIETFRATGGQAAQPYFLALLAEVYGKAGEITAGLTALAEALAAVQSSGEVWYEAELWRLKEELLLAQDGGTIVQLVPTTEAEACFRQALEIARRQQAKSLELRAVMSLSRLWQQGKRDAVRELLAEAYGWFTEGFGTTDLRDARALLAELSLP
jgi:predicted ATPase